MNRRKVTDHLNIPGIAAISSNPSIIRAGRRYDNRLAIIAATQHFHEKIGAILGGEAFSLTGFDRDGRYRSFRTNTSCAAGTGSFLDQQARRLFSSIGDMSENRMPDQTL